MVKITTKKVTRPSLDVPFHTPSQEWLDYCRIHFPDIQVTINVNGLVKTVTITHASEERSNIMYQAYKEFNEGSLEVSERDYNEQNNIIKEIINE